MPWSKGFLYRLLNQINQPFTIKLGSHGSFRSILCEYIVGGLPYRHCIRNWRGDIELIAHYRVDSRVVHGQTTTRVTKENPVDGVIIVDDEISRDKFMLGVFANTLGSIRVLGFSVKKALEKLPEASASKKRYLVIFKTPETARELVEQGFEFDGVLNCGPQPNCDGAKLVEKMLYLTEPQIDALNYLDSRGVKLIINPAFTTPDLTWPEAKRKAGI